MSHGKPTCPPGPVQRRVRRPGRSPQPATALAATSPRAAGGATTTGNRPRSNPAGTRGTRSARRTPRHRRRTRTGSRTRDTLPGTAGRAGRRREGPRTPGTAGVASARRAAATARGSRTPGRRTSPLAPVGHVRPPLRCPPRRTMAINGSRPLDEPSLRTLPASPLHRLVPCASSQTRTRSGGLTRSASHAAAAGTSRYHHRWLPADDGALRGFQRPRDRSRGIQPASENSSGVTIRGGGNPSALSVSYSAGSRSAFAMCLQFQVSR